MQGNVYLQVTDVLSSACLEGQDLRLFVNLRDGRRLTYFFQSLQDIAMFRQGPCLLIKAFACFLLLALAATFLGDACTMPDMKLRAQRLAADGISQSACPSMTVDI